MKTMKFVGVGVGSGAALFMGVQWFIVAAVALVGCLVAARK